MLIQTDKDLLKAIAEYKRIIEEAEAELESLKKIAISRMEDRGTIELKSDEHKATYKEVVSNRFDSKAFKADHADMYEAYRRESSSMRFTFA